MSDAERPRVLILGGGFAGVGAAQKLKHADADVVLVDRHDYHTFQPLLYQLATGLLDTSAVGHSLRDLFARPANATVHKTAVTASTSSAREVRFDDLEPIDLRLPRPRARRRGQLLRHRGRGRARVSRCTRCPDAVRLKDHVLERWEAADRDPELIDDGALNIVIVGGGPTGVETAGALAELYRGELAEDYPDMPEDAARADPRRGGRRALLDVQAELRDYAAKALDEARPSR